MPVPQKVPSCVLELEKLWFLHSFLPLGALVPPKPGEPTVAEVVPEPLPDADQEAENLLYGGRRKRPRAEPTQRTWQEMAVKAFQPDQELHSHMEAMIHEMEEHESEFLDPLHRPWRPRELLKLIENYTKVRCRADMNHCQHCGQMNPSEYKQCLRCRTELSTDELEKAIEGGTASTALQLEGFRILPSPCLKFFLLCQDAESPEWHQELASLLRPLYMLFTSSRFLAADVVTETTAHHVQAAADLNNLSRHLNASLARGRQVVEELQQLVGKAPAEDIKGYWNRIADAALEAQQNLCLMLDAWEEFEGVRLDQWWDNE